MSKHSIPRQNLQYVDTPQALQAVCQQLANQPYLAVDTEFVREKTYFPILCLIQIASPEHIICIDPIAIRDLSPLADLLLHKQTVKIFHAARQDLEILYQTFGSLPAPVFDTQIAATLLGLGDQLSYANLVKHILQEQLSKGHARTDWERRPLSEEQLEYAADDVRYLVAMYPVMVQKLTELGRLNWLDEDFNVLIKPELYHNEPGQQWQRVGGVQKLKGVQLAILQQLAAWREQQAQQQNKPRKWILSDDILIAITMQAPNKLEQLERIRGINTAIIQRQGNSLLEMINRAKSCPKSEWPSLLRRIQLEPNQEALLDALQAIVKLQAAIHGINNTALTSRHDLENLLAGNTDIPLLHGWRHGLAGHAVEAFLNGQSSLSVDKQQLVALPRSD